MTDHFDGKSLGIIDITFLYKFLLDVTACTCTLSQEELLLTTKYNFVLVRYVVIPVS